MSDTDKIALKQRLENEIPLLKQDGWKQEEIDLLKKHFTFYLGLMNGDIKQKTKYNEKFIQNIRDRKNIELDNINEKIY